MIAGGLLCAVIGAAFLWFDLAQGRRPEVSSDWVKGEASLYEAGIRWSNAESGARYAMTARYRLRVAGRDYEGSDIARGYSSSSAAEVRSLIASFAPEAAEYSLEDLGPLNPQRNWSVAYRAVPARYDPRDPVRSQIILAKPLAADSAASWFLRVMAALLALAGVGLLIMAWPVARDRWTAAPPET